MMSGSKLITASLLFLLIFFMASSKLIYCTEDSSISCPEIEKRSLLGFKQSLQDPDNLLSSWDSEEGVFCNNFIGHVNELHLPSASSVDQGLRGKINPSLVDLKHLRYLDLSGNNFGEVIPYFIGSFTQLEYLNLSNAGFRGKVPHTIGNLSNLRSLELQGHAQFTVSGLHRLEVDSLEWMSGLSRLEYLNMNGLNLTGATNWVQVINTLPSLLQLHFHDCLLSFMDPHLYDVNITSLTLLDLSFNDLRVLGIPKWILNLSNLVFLDLSVNLFEGWIPTTSNATKLQHINLSFNYFNSSIPDWLYLCKDLVFVDFSFNLINGVISNNIVNLTSLNSLQLSWNSLSGKLAKEFANLCRLQFLYLSHNELQGEILDPFRDISGCLFKSLQDLDLGGNLFSGAIPDNLGKLSLVYLRLESNEFTGNLPVILGQLFNLKHLYINDNKLEGVVDERNFANIINLEIFSASGNHLTSGLDSALVPTFDS